MKFYSSVFSVLTLVIGLIFSSFLTGCAGSGQSKPYTPAELQVDVDAAVGGFAALRLAGHPQGRPAWERAATGLQNLVDNQNWSVSVFTEAFAVSGASVIENQRIQLVVENGLVVVNALARGRIDMSDPQYARAVIEGALSAIRRVLKSTAPASA